MKITPKVAELGRADAVARVKPGTAQSTGRQAEAAGASRADQVQISDAGRALAGSPEAGGLTAERASQIRSRVLSGAYNQLDVVEQVARTILERGDV